MKSLFTILLTAFYLATSVGVMLNVHYCMDEVQQVMLAKEKSDVCANCGMPQGKDDGCCKDEQKVVKNSADQKISFHSYKFLSDLGLAIIPHSFVREAPQAIPSAGILYGSANAPPKYHGTAIYLLNDSFLI